MAQMLEIKGTVQRLTFHNPVTGFFVAVIKDERGKEHSVRGVSPAINAGEVLAARGQWVRSEWGMQFQSTEIRLAKPTGADDVVKFLASSVKGVGPGMARKLVDALGPDVFSIIEEDPQRLYGIKGIGKKRVDGLLESYKSDKLLRDAMLFLYRAGLGPARAKKVFDTYGENTISLLKANPYLMCRDVWGVGFKVADEAGQKMGIAKDSDFRVRAGVLHMLRQAEGSGSCGCPRAALVHATSQELDVGESLVQTAIDQEILAGTLFKDLDNGGTLCIFTAQLYRAEAGIASALLKAYSRPLSAHVDRLEASILEAELDAGITLEEQQRHAVELALRSNVSIITGGPGCGKSTITRLIIDIYRAQGFNVLLAAPTGKAADRASEATGHPAGTVHRLLEFKGSGPQRNQANPLECDVLVLDEVSMMDVALMLHVLRALPPHARLLLIGDADQLPSVGPGKVLADLLASQALPSVKLRAVFRQGANSDIKHNARLINEGLMPEAGYRKGSDFAYFAFAPTNPRDEQDKANTRKRMHDELLRMCRDMSKRGYDPLKDVQVYSPMRKGHVGIDILNVELQALLNPNPSQTLKIGDSQWRMGDKVMQLRNNKQKEVFNGNVGFIVGIDEERRSLEVSFDGRRVSYEFADLDELRLAYAITIHKSQGSEALVVLIVLDYSHFKLLKRNLVYTGVTRARKLCVLLADPAALKKAVEDNQNDERYTRLARLLEEGAAAAREAVVA